MNYYNEFDPYAAQWLRNLIEAGHIPQGEVDSRSIKDVRASDLTVYVQCHFFAGLGGWSHALRLAGWPDDRPVWTGSCPCQPFSAAGAQKGTADDRHLWPTGFNLIRECRPGVVFGEQVEAAVKHGWLDLVQTDLEGEGYACGAVGLPAGGVGAPHIRQRLWFVADAANNGHLAADGLRETLEPSGQAGAHGVGQSARSGDDSGLADADSGRHDGRATATGRQAGGSTGVASGGTFNQLADADWQRVVFSAECDEDGYCPICKDIDFADCSCPGPTQDEYEYEERSDGLFARRMADSQCEGLEGYDGDGDDRDEPGRVNAQQARSVTPSSWSDCDWLPCRDGKARPVEPIAQQMAYGISYCLGRLRPDEKKEVAHAAKSTGLGDEILHALRVGYDPEKVWQSLGRRIGFSEATLLFAFLCESTGELGSIIYSTASPSPQKCATVLRNLQSHAKTVVRASQGWQLPKQCVVEFANAMHVMPQKNAPMFASLQRLNGHPLIVQDANRVGRLRAYGNAIVPQVAQVFIEAYLES